MAILIHEMADGGLRASLRSRGDVNCQQVAVSLGGGGHKNASGLVMPGGPYEDARQRLLDAARTCLNG
jgi:phosphoesterase RecJ-like protein